MPTDPTDDRTDPTSDRRPIHVEMADGSVFTIDDEPWLTAFDQKYGDRDCEAVLRAFRAAVAEHWDDRTRPWKGLTFEWGTAPYASPDETYDDHADLAHEVMYSSLRAPLMAMAMRDLREDDDESADGPQVIGLRDDGVSVYTGEAKVDYDSLDEVLDDDGEE